MTCILTCINSKKIEIIRIKSVFDKNKNHVEKVVDLITTWFFSIYIIVVSFYCARVGCDQREVIDTHEGGGISIHAPAWGATAKVYKIICKKK